MNIIKLFVAKWGGIFTIVKFSDKVLSFSQLSYIDNVWRVVLNIYKFHFF